MRGRHVRPAASSVHVRRRRAVRGGQRNALIGCNLAVMGAPQDALMRRMLFKSRAQRVVGAVVALAAATAVIVALVTTDQDDRSSRATPGAASAVTGSPVPTGELDSGSSGEAVTIARVPAAPAASSS